MSLLRIQTHEKPHGLEYILPVFYDGIEAVLGYGLAEVD